VGRKRRESLEGEVMSGGARGSVYNELNYGHGGVFGLQRESVVKVDQYSCWAAAGVTKRTQGSTTTPDNLVKE